MNTPVHLQLQCSDAYIIGFRGKTAGITSRGRQLGFAPSVSLIRVPHPFALLLRRVAPRMQIPPRNSSRPTPEAYFVWNCPSRLLASVPVPSPCPVSTLK